MIETTVASTSVFLLTHEPVWRPDQGEGVSVGFSKPSARDDSPSSREEREPLAATLRVTMGFKSILDSTEADALRAIIVDWDNRPVLCPFWPAESLIGDEANASVQGSLRVWYEPDWSDWEVGTGASPSGFTPSADCLTAPVLWGRFDALPEQRIITGGDDELVSFSLIENGSPTYALSPKSVTLTNGDSVNGVNVPLMTPTFAWGTNSEQIEVRIKRAQIGYGREDADTFYPQEVRTKHTLTFDWLETDEAAYLLYLFNNRGGSVSPWWAVAAHSTTDRVYGRFYSDRITIVWELPNRCGEERASCKVDFITLPTEATIPSGETFGETIGPKPGKAFLYAISDGTTTTRATSYESTIAGPGGDYTHQSITHGKIVEEINLQKSDCTLTVQHWTGGPFARLLQHPNSAPLTVTIYEALLTDAENAEAIYTGTAQAPKINKAQMRISLRGVGSILNTEGPRMVLSVDCNAVLGDIRCGVNLAALQITADLLSFADGIAEMDEAAADHDDHYFQNGWIERTVGGVPQRYLIADSYDFGNGNLALVLIGTVLPAITGAESALVFAPGCDGKHTTCKNVFNNLVNFRGAPYLPNDNPSMLAIPQKTPGGKK